MKSRDRQFSVSRVVGVQLSSGTMLSGMNRDQIASAK